MGEHANDYKQIQAKEKLSELQLRVRQLLEQVEQITKEQNYQRVRVTLSYVKYDFRYNWNHTKECQLYQIKLLYIGLRRAHCR